MYKTLWTVQIRILSDEEPSSDGTATKKQYATEKAATSAAERLVVRNLANDVGCEVRVIGFSEHELEYFL